MLLAGALWLRLEEVNWRIFIYNQLNPERKRFLKPNKLQFILYEKSDAFYRFKITPNEKDWFPERGILNSHTVKWFQT